MPQLERSEIKADFLMGSLDEAIGALSASRQILVFSGAGLSTESGIPDFRGPQGLWTRVDPDEFHIDRYLNDRDVRVKGWRMHASGDRWGSSAPRPNRGHRAVVDLEHIGRLAGVVTQNIDGLQQEAGLAEVQIAELHGNFRLSRCVNCGKTWETASVLDRVSAGEEDPHCDDCGSVIKTDVVMFGEELPSNAMVRANAFLEKADAILVVGSTVAVWPASDVVLRAAFKPIPVVIVNLGATEADHLATVKIDSRIGDVLPDLVSALASQ